MGGQPRLWYGWNKQLWLLRSALGFLIVGRLSPGCWCRLSALEVDSWDCSEPAPLLSWCSGPPVLRHPTPQVARMGLSKNPSHITYTILIPCPREPVQIQAFSLAFSAPTVSLFLDQNQNLCGQNNNFMLFSPVLCVCRHFLSVTGSYYTAACPGMCALGGAEHLPTRTRPWACSPW